MAEMNCWREEQLTPLRHKRAPGSSGSCPTIRPRYR